MSMKRKISQKYDNCMLELQFQNNCQINTINAEEKPHLCVNCGKRFKRTDTLKTHQNSCNHEKNIQCTHEGCKETFASRPALKYHLKKHENQTKFICKYAGCQKQFLTQGQLKQHYKTLVHIKQESKQIEIEQQATILPEMELNQSEILDRLWNYVLNVQIQGNQDEQGKQEELNKLKNFMDEQILDETKTAMERVQQELLLIVGLVEKLKQIEDEGIYKVEKIRTALALVDEYYRNVFDKAILKKKRSEPKKFDLEKNMDEMFDQITEDTSELILENQGEEVNFNPEINKYFKQEDQVQEYENVFQFVENNEYEEQRYSNFNEVENLSQMNIESDVNQYNKKYQQNTGSQYNNNFFEFQENFQQNNLFLDMNSRQNSISINVNQTLEFVYN